MPLCRRALSILIAFLLCTSVHGAPPKGFIGVNTATWDPNLDTPRVVAALKGARVTELRFPGGSTSDSYDWTTPSGTTTAQFAHLAHSIDADVAITTNYGSGSPQMAAAWVAYCNAAPTDHIKIGQDAAGRDWKTSGYWAGLRAATPLPSDDGLNHLRAGHSKPFGFRDWEIGNECYGPWETDRRQPKHDAIEYAEFAIAAGRMIRAVDPNARVGIVATECTHPYFCQESVIDPHTRQATSEWTALVLSALSSHGFRPDFVAFHHYAQDSGHESDDKLFRDVQAWPEMVGTLRTDIAEFYGGQAKIGIACTECNSVAFNPGPQTTGEANARYYSQIAPVALRLGIESLIWWDLHNGPNRSGYDTKSPLNQLPYGDYGILRSDDRQDQPYPIYLAIRQFATKRQK